MVSCEECSSECCRYITITLAEPKTAEDWDEIKWQLMHEMVMVYKDLDGEWNVEIRTKCTHLDEKTNRCKNYAARPLVCRNHETHECEQNEGGFAEVIFRKPEDVDEYLKNKK